MTFKLLSQGGKLYPGFCRLPVQVLYSSTLSSFVVQLAGIEVRFAKTQQVLKRIGPRELKRAFGSLSLLPGKSLTGSFVVPTIVGGSIELVVHSKELSLLQVFTGRPGNLKQTGSTVQSRKSVKFVSSIPSSLIRSFPFQTIAVRAQQSSAEEQRRTLYLTTLQLKLQGVWKNLSDSEKRKRAYQLKYKMLK